MSRKPSYTDEDIIILKDLYFAHYLPKEAADYIASQYSRTILPGTISRLYQAFKLSNTPRYDKSQLLQLNNGQK